MHLRHSLELLIYILNFETLNWHHPVNFDNPSPYDRRLNNISTNQGPPKAILERVINKSPNAQLDLLQFSAVFEAAPLIGLCSGKWMERRCIPGATPVSQPTTVA